MKYWLIAWLALWGVNCERIGASKRDSPGGSEPAAQSAPDAAEPPGDAPEGMVWIPGGSFPMGSEAGQANEQPVHQVKVKGFWMDITEITNREFARFVDATGYITTCEKEFSPEEYPNAPPGSLRAGALLFAPPPHPVDLKGSHMQWWEFVPGADWKHPEGPDSSIQGRDDHPVVCVTWDDAVAYAKWAGKRLPSEAEWEWAARAGQFDRDFVWGKEFRPDGKWPANIWQGDFPGENTAEDGFATTAPVKSFAPNEYGLHDMSGNVWEFVSDWYLPAYYRQSPRENPPGPSERQVLRYAEEVMAGYEPQYRERALRKLMQDHILAGPGVARKVIRGGSFLCNDCYCKGYRPTARQTTDAITGTNHTGFRCVKYPVGGN